MLADGGLVQGAVGLRQQLAEQFNRPVQPVGDPQDVRFEDAQAQRGGVVVPGLGEQFGGLGGVPFDEADEDQVAGVGRGRQRLGAGSPH